MAGDASAYLLDGRTGELRPAARGTGTTVEVKELFYSHPGAAQVPQDRRHRAGALRRGGAPPRAGAARRGLCRSGTRASWSSSGAPTTLEQRLADVLGEDFLAQSIAVDYTRGHGAR